MARIISFQHSRGFTSINLETVRRLSSGWHWLYDEKKVKVERSFWRKLWKGVWDDEWDDEYVYTKEKSRPEWWLTFEYKNSRQEDDTFYFDKDEYEQVKAELARYGWKVM